MLNIVTPDSVLTIYLTLQPNGLNRYLNVAIVASFFRLAHALTWLMFRDRVYITITLKYHARSYFIFTVTQ